MADISIALSKGRIFDETLPLLARIGIRPKVAPERSRKLVIATNRRGVRLIVVRPFKEMMDSTGPQLFAASDTLADIRLKCRGPERKPVLFYLIDK